MARVVVEGMPETAVGGGGGGVMLSRRRSKARRRKRKDLFVFQMCFAGLLLGLVLGFQSLTQNAGERQFTRGSFHVYENITNVNLVKKPSFGHAEFLASRNNRQF